MSLADRLLPWRIAEARKAAQRTVPIQAMSAPGRTIPGRSGYVQGVPPGGMNDTRAGMGAATETDRSTVLGELWDAYLKCPWAWAAVNAIARTVTAGGLLMKWDSDTGEGDQRQPSKPAAVLAFERLIAFCNPVQDIRQVMRNVVADLEVFGDAYLEVVWLGKLPVAIYNLDCPTTTPTTDDHGRVTGYVQVTQYGQRAAFTVDEVIHISLDSARPGVFGVSPTAAAILPVTTWLFAAACEKQMFRKGLPPNVHIDFPAGKPQKEIELWVDEYRASVIGPDNIGTPVTSKGGAKANELQTGKILDILKAKDQARDAILSAYGVPPSKAGVIESGNLGGGTGTSQNKTFWLDTINPVAMLIAEKLQFALAVKAFGVEGWHAEFGGVDYRDDKVIEDIRDQRLRAGAWTLNRWRADIGEPPVPGGDDAVLVARQDIVLWNDMARRSAASVAMMAAGGSGEEPPALGRPGPPPAVGTEPSKGQGGAPDPTEADIAAYLAEHTPRRTTGQRVYAQLSRNFPATALSWVHDARWQGPVNVGADLIQTDHLDEWTASHDGPDMDRLRRKIRRGGKAKPAVLIRTPGSTRDIIVDGHHHALAALKEGLPVRAYVGHVDTDSGDWEVLAMRQHRRAA